MWPFSKEKHEKKWVDLHLTLSKSFKNIKTDMLKIFNNISLIDNKHSESIKNLHIRLTKLERTLQLLDITLPSSQNYENQSESSYYPKNYKKKDLNLDFLTNLHKSILLNTSLLISENSQNLIAMKYLAQEMYPKHEYNRVKSVLSNYTDNLEELGFIKKERKGRQTYISLTKKAKSIITQIKISNQLKTTVN